MVGQAPLNKLVPLKGKRLELHGPRVHSYTDISQAISKVGAGNRISVNTSLNVFYCLYANRNLRLRGRYKQTVLGGMDQSLGVSYILNSMVASWCCPVQHSAKVIL